MHAWEGGREGVRKGKRKGKGEKLLDQILRSKEKKSKPALQII